MKRTGFTIAMLLTCGLWTIAQQNPLGSAGHAASQAGQSAGQAASQAGQAVKQAGESAADKAGQTAKDTGEAVMNATRMKVQGCLSGSEGSFTLTDKSGTTYQLTGNTTSLNAHVDHEIQVTGTTAEAAASAVGSTPKSIEVTKFKEIASKCSSSSTSKPPQSK